MDRRKEVLRNALASARRSHELTRQLKKEGAETQLAVDQFYARVLSIESKLLENDQLIGEKERAIACLLGVFPFEIRRMGFDELRKLPVPLSEGIPANLLTLRPDVRSAEMGLIASKADVIAAKAAFYPSLVLGASGGFNAFDVGKWFHSPASLVYDLAAGITAPIFRRDEIRSMWNEAKASQRIALSQYHETALNAYTEVLDLYCASQTQTERIRLKEKESLAHQRSVVNAGEMFQLSYTGSWRFFPPRSVIWIASWSISISSPIYAGRRYCCTGRWEAVVDFYRDAIVIVLQPALQCYCTPVASSAAPCVAVLLQYRDCQ